jgi:DNA-binding CsgD family transcriptional regulator
MESDLLIFKRDEWQRLAQELALSPRQSDVMYLLLTGKSDKQISKEAGIALPTVRTHFGRLFQKFNVQDRSELILSVFYHYKYHSTANDK